MAMVMVVLYDVDFGCLRERDNKCIAHVGSSLHILCNNMCLRLHKLGLKFLVSRRRHGWFGGGRRRFDFTQ